MTNSLQKLEYAVPLGSINSYIHWANQVPMLTAEEEHQLALEYSKNGDLNAAKRLVMAHLRFVISISRNYTGYGISHSLRPYSRRQCGADESGEKIRP